MRDFVEIDWGGERVRIECERIHGASAANVVFLHEGLGSVSMWRDFPRRLCEAAGVCGIVFSRPGYGRSSLPASRRRRGPDYLHRQAYEVLPAFLEAAGLGEGRPAPWLFGHSDGGSIALLHAARFRARTAGIVVVAPHIFVEPVTIAGIEEARAAWATTGLRDRLARHHDDPEWVFRSWCDTWLDPRFREWNIEHEIEAIRCPVLAVQGARDEYGTLEQVRGIARRVAQAQLVELAGSGHSPQRDQPDALIAAARGFIASARG